MIEWRTGVVQHVTDPLESKGGGLQEVEVLMDDGDCETIEKAVHSTDIFPALEAGDKVLLNTTAVSLHLGTGGVHFVHAILSKSTKNNRGAGHIMKLRYTSLQRAVLAAEEPSSPYHDLFSGSNQALDGMPVLIGELHSMLPAAVCYIRQLDHETEKPIRIAYIMSDGGALPIAYSKHVIQLRKLGWLTGTITYGHAYGGDIETVNKHTALLAAKHILHADLTIVTMGPGCVGTNTQFGFSGLEVGEIANAVSALNGQPIVIPRISFADKRDRHYGISHHTLTILRDIAQPGVIAAMPDLDSERGDCLRIQIEHAGLIHKHKLQWMTDSSLYIHEVALRAYSMPITSMGRELHSDPAFFAGVRAAAAAACSCLQGYKQQPHHRDEVDA
ncbi:DUF3866 family protein [Paenibacillus radicis (ex Xue et al. 2023)]|uniref:DUF3866 family protein n=1 Tax=Paenibacillus radicis (ex Xue et al. 2023) TaxID=2972489 RepID=A0ABT1YL25_9BACL|nr:DUF3866 family protein [Paenibacillus radicis (ex Xue et al. 2023)]MCR8633878.1 DUF3866 family protein [Paenibacillus radicis (ex Xue et al. 2023)]